MKIKSNDLYIILPVIFIFLFVIVISPVNLQNDTFYDIVLGQRYIASGMFKIDDYSIHQGLIYQTHHYLVTIITYLVYHIGSFFGLYLLQIMLTLLLAFSLHLVNREFIKGTGLRFIMLIFELFMLSPFVALRAQMYSYIIFILEILFLQRYLRTSSKKYLACLSLLPLLLINVHSGVIYYYFIILGLYILSRIKVKILFINIVPDIEAKHFKNLIFAFIIGAFLTIFNPYGIDGITYGLKTIDNTFIKTVITEFAPFNGQMGPRGWLFLLVFFTIIIVNINKIKTRELLLFLGTFYMTLNGWRHFSLLIISSLLLLPYIEKIYLKLKEFLKNKLSPDELFLVQKITIITIFITYLIVSVNTISTRKGVFVSVPEKEYPVMATEYIKKNLPENARIFNKYEWGSYLMFKGIKVFIDSRCDLYTEEYNPGTRVALDYNDADNLTIGYQEIANKYNLEYFLVAKDSYLSQILIHNKANQVIYEDGISRIVKIVRDK